MWSCIACVFAIWLNNLAIAETEILYTNGWIPMINSDTIYSQWNRATTIQPSTQATHNVQVLYTNINNVIKPDTIQDNIVLSEAGDSESSGRDKPCQDCTEEIPTHIEPENNGFKPNVIKFPTDLNDTSNKTRRSKHVRNYQTKYYAENKLQKENKTYEKTPKQEIKRYEVTETFDDINEQVKSETRNAGYEYEPPKNELTNEFYNILSKYKIRGSYELRNYALSRIPRVQIPAKAIIPFVVPQKYNNLNHLPADPLLAVLLSHYGFYLHGLYGIHNNYQNLYGYLASNNIHNNRPFGFYKLFSDTDSSH